MERAFYLLAYDIADPKRLAKVAKRMEAVAERVQDSVFEGYFTAAELEKLYKSLNKVFDEKEDSLRVYLLCSACRGKVLIRGKGKATPPPAAAVV